VHGVSTRKLDGLIQAMGLDGIPKSQVSRLCETLDAEVERFRHHPLEGAYPYVWSNATFVKVRDGGRVVSMAVVVASGVQSSGEREVLGLGVGPSEDGAFWDHFCAAWSLAALAGSNWSPAVPTRA
jgi:putative transposase